jgi:hypothetical protein
MYIDTNVAKIIVVGNVAKVVVPNMKRGESYSAQMAVFFNTMYLHQYPSW